MAFPPSVLATAAETDSPGAKKADLVFVIDSTGSMADEINNVKTRIAAFTNALEAQGVQIRIGVVEYRDITEDGLSSTVIHELNHSPWLRNTTEMVDMLGNISVDGGGDTPETVIDGLGYLVGNKTIPWSSDAYKFAVVLTDANYKVDNRHGYGSLQEISDALLRKGINTSVITPTGEFGTYSALSDTTGGILADIYSDFDTVLEDLVKNILGMTSGSKKAIYVLPGYLGSELYDGADGTDGGKRLWFPENILDLDTIVGQSNLQKFYQDGDSNGTGLHIDYERDDYGTMDTYEALVKRLKKDFGDDYDVKFFPYNWLEDLNDSEIKLENDILKNGYSEVVFVTHSTGGLLASAYISKSNANKLKVSKAILIAAPLFGTYASILPLERGDSRKTGNLLTSDFWIDAITSNSWIRGWAKNSPTTYQLLPGSEYLQYLPLQDKGGWLDGERAITSVDDYYGVLNQSVNVNPKLTNGSNRSHEYFRETALRGDVVKQWSVASLLEVDTLLICTTSGHSTTSVAVYNEPLIGTHRQLKDILYNKNGDGTVQGLSAKGEKKGSTTPLRTAFYGYDHGELAKNPNVLDRISNEIRSLGISAASLEPLSAAAGISELIKIRYEADLPVTATIYDSSGAIVAQATGDEYTGFDGEDFIYDSFADSPDVTEASLYMPNSGYKVILTHGSEAGVNIDFKAEVSTLVDDGWKDVSVSNSANVTLDDGVISSFDGTEEAILNDSISDIIDGDVNDRLTDWELVDTIKLNVGDVEPADVVGSEASGVIPLLNWTSADESIATVSSDGVITATGFGRTTIAATDGNKSSVSEVTVMQDATSVSFSDVDMVIGERTLIRPTFTPATATETELTYSVDKEGVVQIDEHGVIHAVAVGEVTVTGITSYGISADFVVVVSDDTNYGVESVSIPASTSVEVGKTISVSVEFTPANATNRELRWYVDDDSIVSLSEGAGKADITGLKMGSTKVTVVSVDGGYTADCIVTVADAEPSVPPSELADEPPTEVVSDNQTDSELPPMGDNSTIALLITLCTVSLAALVSMAFGVSRNKRRREA
jgi:uncharacterized protein YjdB/pimeloyl-ACP methyl ester carboxylesterase/Mg-chelatase subunit ChlD